MSRVKNLVVTHDGIFHSDEVIAIALLTFGQDNLKIVRTRYKASIDTAEFTIDVGGEYAPKEGKFDHHQFKDEVLDRDGNIITPRDPFYGLSSAGLIWKETRPHILEKIPDGNIKELDRFIEAVDARDTRVDYDESNVYEPIFDAITAFNDIDPMSYDQNDLFTAAVAITKKIIMALLGNDVKTYTEIITEMEHTTEVIDKLKAETFKERALAVVHIEGAAVSEFFPDWRKASKELGMPFIMPGDHPGEYKIMMDTSKNRIVTARDAKFVHNNGFIAVVKPNGVSTHIGIALLDGRLLEVSLAEIKKVLDK